MPETQSYLILFIVWLLSAILVKLIFGKTRPKLRLPPSPPALPIIGHLHLLAPIPHQALHKLSTRYGPLIHLSLGSLPCVVASSPEVAKEFLKTQERSFANRPQMIAVDYLTYGSVDFSFAPYGPYWKFMKKICMSQLLSGPRLEQFRALRGEEMAKFLNALLRKGEANEAVGVGRELMKLTNNVMSRMSFGESCCGSESQAEEVRKMVAGVAELTGKFNLSDYIWFCKKLDLQGFGKRLKELRRTFDAMMERIIREHEEARKCKGKREGDLVAKDLLHLLLDISDDESSEIKLTRENIKAFILDLFVAGTDTSAITIEWALAELVKHPKIINKAREEIDDVVGRIRLVRESDIANLPYLQVIVKETLRLHPAGPIILRESSEKCTVNGYDIPEKTQLFVNVWAIGRDPKHWEEPLEFKPERFLGEQESGNISQVDVRGQHFHLLPFGSGRRSCPGASLGMLVVQTTLAAMLQCFEWKIKAKDGTVDMEEGTGITLARANPLVCVPIARFNPLPM